MMPKAALLHCGLSGGAWETDMRNPWRLLAAALIPLALLHVEPAAAQFSEIFGGKGSTPDTWKVCEGQDGATLEQRLGACGAIIDSGILESDDNRAGAYANRASALQESGVL